VWNFKFLAAYTLLAEPLAQRAECNKAGAVYKFKNTNLAHVHKINCNFKKNLIGIIQRNFTLVYEKNYKYCLDF